MPKGSNVAATLEAHGLPLIVACRSGICGSCKCKTTPNITTSTSAETLKKKKSNKAIFLLVLLQLLQMQKLALHKKMSVEINHRHIFKLAE
ncbi:hypothetical protein UB33_18605 [Photobacterium angustum]|uniref:2Fe-2S iron-sulfur cluster-binding protein n=1 Tax=Photobacterium angustum TaxID=661 RepID=UPI0005E54CC2|nr:2Fe-2S iron-sulfur cluster-binding protein [Photobacterium angustum]KJG04491.1 hypothetical protein UB33_18605 [Photobacterium angustum]